MNTKASTWIRRTGLIVGIAVAITGVVAAFRQSSWTPIATLAWLPAVFVAVYTRPTGRCLPRRRRSSIPE
jgi:hypothetical protein